MQIIRATLDHESRSGSWTYGKKSSRRFTKTYQVQTNDAAMGPLMIREQFIAAYSAYVEEGLEEGQGDSYDLGALLSGVQISGMGQEGVHWKVTLEFTTNDEGGGEQEENPLDRPIEITYSAEKFQRAITKDADGKTLQTVCGEPYDPPVEIDDSRGTLVIVRNEAFFDEDLADEFRDTVNAGVFMGRPAGTVKCDSITGQSQTESGVTYFKVTYEFHRNRDGWDHEILHQGFRGKVTETIGGQEVTRIKQLTDADGNPYSQPALLNEQGFEMKKEKDTDPDVVPVYQKYKTYPRRNFNVFGFR